ncbi:Clathrin light chain isoform 1 [Schistosoma japonicum]
MSADGVLNDFLAREKKDLYGLESDLNFLPNGDNNGSEHPKVNDEPECIRRWAISFQKRIDVKDDAERKSLSVLEEQGLKDLHDWALQYRDSLSRGQKLSRAHDKELRSAQKKAAEASVGMAQVDAGQAVLWERVCQLCNFVISSNEEGTNTQTVPTNTKDNQRDLNRMRVLLLQLKKNPPAVQSNIRFH